MDGDPNSISQGSAFTFNIYKKLDNLSTVITRIYNETGSSFDNSYFTIEILYQTPNLLYEEVLSYTL